MQAFDRAKRIIQLILWEILLICFCAMLFLPQPEAKLLSIWLILFSTIKICLITQQVFNSVSPCHPAEESTLNWLRVAILLNFAWIAYATSVYVSILFIGLTGYLIWDRKLLRKSCSAKNKSEAAEDEIQQRII